MKPQLIIFDWAGTTVDYGCFAPVNAFALAFQKFGVNPTVEEIRAHAGIDIGGTLIGMHLRRVAVPVRLSLNRIGEANILCARTRPKLIGGERAKYTEED